MSKLFKRAKVQLALARDCYVHISDDDAYTDACCYCLQQSIELSLKYLVEINGESFAENHDLRANLNKLDRIGIAVPDKELLRSMASTLYSWETESRYRDDFIALTEDIENAMAIADELISFADVLVSQVAISEEQEYPEGNLTLPSST